MSDIPTELNRKVTRLLHDQGMEVTPDEVVEIRKEAHKKLRIALKEKGITVPDGDLEFLEWMRKIGLNKEDW